MGRASFESTRDLLSVPPDQLSLCLAALHEWILRSKRLIALAEAAGADTSKLEIEPFAWSPNEKRTVEAAVTPDTPIEELGIRRSAVHRMQELNIYRLEDLALASEDELLTMKDVGRTTVEQLREMLRKHGLTFKASDRPWRRDMDRAAVAHRTPASERRLSDQSPITDLGLRPATANRCLERGIESIGALRALTLRDLYVKFGKASIRELVQTLKSVGMTLHSAPGVLAQWEYGVLNLNELKRPGDDAAVEELAPWLGASVTKALGKSGATTVAAARAVAIEAKEGSCRRQGLGAHSQTRLLEYFGLSSPAIPRPVMDRRSSPFANPFPEDQAGE